jgi:hypothetical protein
MLRPAKSWLRLLLPLPLLWLGACSSGKETPNCGIAALAGPSLLLEEFTKPGRTLSAVPHGMPEVLPVRMAASDAYRGIVGEADTTWIIGIDAPLPAKPTPGFGVLLVDVEKGPQGVLLFEGPPIARAPILGSVNAGSLNVPLIGIRTALQNFQDPHCPLFPDSLRHR